MSTDVIITKPEPYCPSCGARMVLRRPKPNQKWKPFWGCSQFPDCHGTRNINPDGTPQDDDDYDDYDEDDSHPGHPNNYGDR